MNPIDDLLERQDGVISRRQVVAAGGTSADIARHVRRRVWTRVHPGVYVNHTGPLTFPQRAWASVLACAPAALGGWSAVRAHEGPGRRGGQDGPIEVIIRQGRDHAPLSGIVIRRTRRFDETAQLQLSPPRQRYEDALIDLADRARDEMAAIAILADACGGRRTTATRLRARMDTMARLTRRDWLGQLLDDVAHGTCSVLEHGYLTLVERPHGLPRGLRQLEHHDASGRRMFRDVVYRGEGWTQYVELDGRLHHDSASARDRDLERDLDAALDLTDTVRLGYGQVFGRACRTAYKVGRLLRLRGATDQIHPCPRCKRADWFDSGAAGAPESTR